MGQKGDVVEDNLVFLAHGDLRNRSAAPERASVRPCCRLHRPVPSSRLRRGGFISLLLGWMAIAPGLVSGLARAQSLTDPLPLHLLTDEQNTIEVFRQASRSVVFVTNNQLRRDLFSRNVMEVPRGSGSGFVWDRDGHIVTNFHVIHGGNALYVTLADGSLHDAKLAGYDETKDLAVLEIDAGESELVPVEPGRSDDLLVGQKVIAIGNPFGLDQTLTTGVISALGREIMSVAGTTISDVIQTDASINPGNSGGPLLDSAGRLIGVNTSIYSTSGSSAGIGFAVPVSTVQRVVPQLIESGKVSRAGLGIILFEDDLARRWDVEGVIIREVSPGSAAEKAGLRGSDVRGRRVELGDIIVGVDGREVRNFNDLFTSLDRHRPGDRVRVRFLRDDDEHEVEVALQEIR